MFLFLQGKGKVIPLLFSPSNTKLQTFSDQDFFGELLVRGLLAWQAIALFFLLLWDWRNLPEGVNWPILLDLLFLVFLFQF